MKYIIDGLPRSTTRVIQIAEYLDKDFAKSWIKPVEQALKIIRKHGLKVETVHD